MENTSLVFETVNIEEFANTDGVFVNVPILGAKSRNKRIYTAEAMKEGAALYNEASVFVDHAPGRRKSEDKLGVIKNARFDEELNQIRGDLYLLKTHPLYTRIVEDVERGLNCYGLSHSAQVWSKRNNEGIMEVSKIETVASVDLVSTPATLKSLTESEETHRADYLELVREEATALINTVINEAADTLADLIKNKLESVLEEMNQERLKKLSGNPYAQVINVNKEPVPINMPETKDAARNYLLTL
jgi:hypothetical protein